MLTILSDIKNKIMMEEAEFPKMFTNYEEHDYGILFHNADNKNSNDSNHAFIYPERITDLRCVLNEITDFYKNKDLTDYFSIYHPFADNYFIDNADVFKDCGYKFEIYPDLRCMLLTGECKIDIPNQLDIRYIDKWNEKIADDVLVCVANKEHFRDVVKHSMKFNNYLFIGYFEGEAASLLAFHVSEYGITRFDEMGTAEKYKNRGFAREMNRYAVRFVRERNLPVAYQWPAHDTSERITTEAGFRVAFTLPSGSAVKF